MSIKVRPEKMVICGDGQFGTLWVYECDKHSIEDVLKEGAYSSFRDNLRPGDRVRIVEMKDSVVTATAEIMITGKLQTDVTFQMMHGGIQRFDKLEMEETSEEEDSKPETYIHGDGKVKWNPGKKVHQVYVGDELVMETKDKDEAYSVARGDIAIAS